MVVEPQGLEQALQAQTGTQGNAMLRLEMDPQGFVGVLPKPKASSTVSKWLGLDVIRMLSQTPPISDPQEFIRPFAGNGLPGDTQQSTKQRNPRPCEGGQEN